MNHTDHRCLACGKPLSGRSDKKFCDGDCRSLFHNARYRTEHKECLPVRRILVRNHSILSALIKKGVRSCRLSVLEADGFSIRYFTAADLPGPAGTERAPEQSPGKNSEAPAETAPDETTHRKRKSGKYRKQHIVYYCYNYKYKLSGERLFLIG